ncbi:hypothetical protein [Agromyces sp. CCNWLW203]|uniref:hypothetical protein n=1 Tax=Agromyces sp. CCNWLW203 TaxID=3112842 RepID=UPI002F96C63E
MSKPGAALAHADGDARTRVRWSSRRPFRRIAAILTSLALGAGLAVVGVAAPASAHTGDLKAAAVCNTETGKYDVTYTLKLSNAKGKTGATEWRVGTTNFERTPTNSDGMDRGPVESKGNETITLGTVELAGTAKTGPWVYAYTTWNDGFGLGSDGRVEGLNGTCGDELPDKVCDPLDTGHLKAGNKTSLEITAPDGKLIAEVCVKAGSVNNGNGPEYTTVTPPSKTYTISHSSGKEISHYSVRYVEVPKTVPVPAQPEKQDFCGTVNDRIVAPADTVDVEWEIGEIVEGTAEAVATTTGGKKFADGTTSKVFAFTFTDEPCVITVEAVPSVTDTCGPDNEAVTLPANTDKVVWTSAKAGSVVTVTATAQKGFIFAEGLVKTWTFDVSDFPCIIEIVDEPTFEDTCGPDNEVLEVPENTDAITWTSQEVDGVITVTATATPGNTFPGSTTKTWTFTVDDEPCVIETDEKPTFEDKCGPDNEVLEIPESTDAITWTSEEVDGVITVTATAKKGSTFPTGATKTWTFKVDDGPCLIELVGAPTFEDWCGPENEKLVVPQSTDTTLWTSERANGVITVTASAKPGYAFAKGPFTWKYAYSDAKCIEPSLTGSVATGVCEADSPWIFFDVELTDPDEQSTGNTASLVMSDGTNTETIELGELKDGSLTGKVLWPGASVDENGTANGWPGWALVGDKWIEVDDNFAWTRGDITATLEVNPELDVAISYPPATPNCATGPKSTPPGGGAGTTPTASDGTGLASTGFAGTTIAIIAGIIVVAGVAFLVVARIRRKRA